MHKNMHKKKTFWAGLFAILVLVGLLYRADETVQEGVQASTPFDGSVIVKATPFTLDTEHRFPNDITFVAGWQLEADHPDFGGWSGMVLEEDGRKLLAINDKGIWMQADVDVSSIKQPLGNVMLFPYTKEAGGDKEALDAESLIKGKTGYIVSFEGAHRLEVVPDNFMEGVPQVLQTGVNYRAMGENSGLEAIAQDAEGNLFLFAENGRDIAGTLPAWQTRDGIVREFRLRPPKNFSPTDAAVLPCGDILLLMRRYSAIEGVFAKLVLLPRHELSQGMVVANREILDLAAPFPLDNMEALDFVVLPDGIVRLFMLSDDNFNAFQDTVLLVFDWKPTTACTK